MSRTTTLAVTTQSTSVMSFMTASTRSSGNWATVPTRRSGWRGTSSRHDRYVALKVLVSAESVSTTESRILHHLLQAAPVEAANFTTQLLDEFTHDGPNGTHRCLAFEPMGPSVNTMVEELPQFKPPRWEMKVRYPPAMAKSILRQALQGLEFLHKNNVAHGGFQPGNMLFALQNLDTQPEDALRQDSQDKTSISAPVQRLDGKQDRWAPRYLCVAQPLALFASHLGGAYFIPDPPAEIVTPLGLRAPELLLKEERNPTLDIWSFGCLVFELITGTPLLCIPYSEGLERDDYVIQLTARLGPLPDHLFQAWPNSSLYYTPEGELYNSELGGVPDGSTEPLLLEQETMEECFDQAEPDVDDAEALQIKGLIRRILKYGPSERPSAAGILLDPWFYCETETVACHGTDMKVEEQNLMKARN
ncbi:kinase-like domain-containing protein [Microdochium bolleyi]|uniref:Kinase-like domain-containing protein n=1 Tax=Microdochium bolleyi TaxID=196109 RepID=A0A136J9A3_9PEZI|nr:kinase-like domain-containing protein [Microdochium bolleyi]